MKAVMACVLIVGVFPGVASAVDWADVGETEAEHVLLDRDSLHLDGGVLKARAIHSYAGEQTLGDDFYPHRSKVIGYVVDCAAQALAAREWSFQSGAIGSGRTVWAGHATRPDFFTPDAGSAHAALVSQACQLWAARSAAPVAAADR
jgi:hypothetical protein